MRNFVKKAISIALSIAMVICFLPGLDTPVYADAVPCTVITHAYNGTGASPGTGYQIETGSYSPYYGSDLHVGDTIDVFSAWKAAYKESMNEGHEFGSILSIDNTDVVSSPNGRYVTIVGAGEANIYWNCPQNGDDHKNIRLKVNISLEDVRRDINECTFSSVENHYYDGQDYKPIVTVRDGGRTLTRDVDYTLTWYSLYGDAGPFNIILPNEQYPTWDYYVQVSGIGGYKNAKNIHYSILPANDSISFSGTSVTKTYGDGNFTKAVTKAQNGDGTVTYSSSNTNVATVNNSGTVTIRGAGSTTITANAAKTGVYNYPAPGNTTSYTLTVNKATLTATANNKTITYGDAAPTYNISYSGWKGSDNASNAAGFTAPRISCSYAQFGNVGSYDITLSGGSANNYNITRNNGTLTVNRKTVTVTGAVAADKDYDGTTNVVMSIEDGSIDGLVNDDDVTFAEARGVFDNYNAGTGKTVTVTPILAGEKASNYTPVHANITADIAKRDVTVKASAQIVELGDRVVQNEVELAGGSLASGDAITAASLSPAAAQLALTGGTPLVIAVEAGSVVIKKGGNVNVTGNYNISLEEGALTVIPTRPRVDILPGAAEITYGQSLIDSLFSGGKMVNRHDASTEVSGTFSWKLPNLRPAANIDPSSGPTEYTVVFTPDDLVNYSPKEFELALTVAKAELTITADDKEKTYRTSDPALTYTVRGYENGDTASVLTGELSRTPGEAVVNGGYAIGIGSLAPNHNYTINFTGAVLTVTKAAQSAPAIGEGFTITGGRLDIADTTNTAANNETHYEVTDDDGETIITYNTPIFDINPEKSYRIRWEGGNNYEESSWTDMRTTATISVRPTPAGSGSFTLDGEESEVVPLDKVVTLEALPDSSHRFAAWQKDGEIISYNSTITFTVTEDAVYVPVFVDRAKTVVKLPEMTSGTFTYDGTEQTAVRIDSAEGYVLENHQKTDAGSYTATARLADSRFIWADGTSTPKSMPWSIGKANLSAPTVTAEGSTMHVAVPTVTPVQTEPFTAYYSQDRNLPMSSWTEVPEGGIENAIGLYYFYVKGNNNYNDSPMAQRSAGKPTRVATIQPTSLTTASAVINGSIYDPDGNLSTDPETRIRFEWKQQGMTGWTALDTPNYSYTTGAAFNVSCNLTGLQADRDYCFRLVATLKNGNEVTGRTLKFRTPAEAVPTGSISVTVNSTAPGRDVVVSVEEGNDVISARELSTNGTTTFTSLPDGFFNVVTRSKDGQFVETRMIAIENGAGVTTVFNIPEGKLASTVEIKTESTPPVAVEGLKDIITNSEKTAAAAGTKNVEVALEVEKKAENAAAGSGAIMNIMPQDKQVDMYLDLSLLKTTTDVNAQGVVTGVQTSDIGGTNNKVLEIAIPYGFARTKADEIQMFRYHGGMAQALTRLANRPTAPFADGRFYVDQESGYVFLYASGFSTYAIALDRTASTHYRASTEEVPAAPEQELATVADPTVTGVADWLITDEHITYISGYSDGRVIPTGNITRAEVAVIFHRLLKNKDVEITKGFGDVKAGIWYEDAVKTLASLGIITGYEDNNFYPNKQISRAEFAAIATRFAKAADGGAKFADVTSAHWAYGNVATAAGYGWVNGYSDGRFIPAGNITRAEVATIVNHMLGRSADSEWVLANPDGIAQFSDMKDAKQWYYFDMVEATSEHDFTKDGGKEHWTK